MEGIIQALPSPAMLNLSPELEFEAVKLYEPDVGYSLASTGCQSSILSEALHHLGPARSSKEIPVDGICRKAICVPNSSNERLGFWEGSHRISHKFLPIFCGFILILEHCQCVLSSLVSLDHIRSCGRFVEEMQGISSRKGKKKTYIFGKAE